MEVQNMKNIVILKNLPSNMVEEAFIVLKDNVKVHKEEFASNKKEVKKIGKDKNYVIKEAEMIVTDYIDKIDEKKLKNVKEKIKLEAKCKKLKYLNIFFVMFSILSVISMILR